MSVSWPGLGNEQETRRVRCRQRIRNVGLGGADEIRCRPPSVGAAQIILVEHLVIQADHGRPFESGIGESD